MDWQKFFKWYSCTTLAGWRSVLWNAASSSIFSFEQCQYSKCAVNAKPKIPPLPLSVYFTKLIMSTEAFCIFKRSRVTFRLKRTCHPDRKLPHKRRGCVDGRFSNTTLLSSCLSHASQSHPPTHLFSPSLIPSSLAHFLTFSQSWLKRNSTQCDFFC